MSSSAMRRPLGNFFIKRSLQIRLILKVVLAVLISTIVSSFSLIFVYFIKYNTVIVYFLEKLTQELTREHIIFLILPTLVISFVVNIFVAIGIGMYASRKYAVPIYKLEQWATLLCEGKLTVTLRFREKEEMRELSEKCNQFATHLSERFQTMKKQVETLKEKGVPESDLKVLQDILNEVETEKPIEVNTTFMRTEKNKDGEITVKQS
jgi:hypothetical protein